MIKSWLSFRYQKYSANFKKSEVILEQNSNRKTTVTLCHFMNNKYFKFSFDESELKGNIIFLSS